MSSEESGAKAKEWKRKRKQELFLLTPDYLLLTKTVINQ